MIPVGRSHLLIAAHSHPGMSGKNNEDRYAVSAFKLSDQNPVPVVFAIVSDGVGGHHAGEIAAEIAVETISRAVAASDASHPIQTLKEAIQAASQEIYNQADSDPKKRGMAATCACAWIIDKQLYISTVGDSRIYLVRGEEIRQISTDHTWIQEALEAGALTPDQARGHPNAHVIRRFLGSQTPAEPDARLRLKDGESDEQAVANQGLTLSPGDRLVLCSDGLTDLISKEEILDKLKSKDQSRAIKSLIDLANERGGHDNITMITIQVPETVANAVPLTQAKPKKRLRWTCLAALILLILIVALSLTGVFVYLNRTTLFPGLATNTPLHALPTVKLPTDALVPNQTQLILPEATTQASPTLALPTFTPTQLISTATLTPTPTP